MKTLILMRHAKSDWSTPGQPDRERALNPRGRRAATLIGAWLADEGHAPDGALVSGAIRARETWARVSRQLPHPPDAKFDNGLYLCDPETIREAIQDAPACKRLIVIGHNPGMGSAMSLFSDDAKRLESPTAATAIYELPIRHWKDAAFETGRLTAFQVPKSLV